MSKISTVSPIVIDSYQRVASVIGAQTRYWSTGVILFSFLSLAALCLQGCGNKGDLYREADAAAIDGLQEAADKLRNRTEESEQDDEDDDDDDDEDDEKKDSRNTAADD